MAETPRLCAICGKRRPKRFCPGVNGDICPVCCGTEREVTVSCPLDCAYLQDAREHENRPDLDPRTVPNMDIRVDEAFLKRNEPLLVLAAARIAASALSTDGAVDSDVRDALSGLVRTYRTLQSGIYYEARPDNPLAARIYDAVQSRVQELRAELGEHGHSLRDADVLGVLAFLQRIEYQHNNGRRKGRACIDMLRGFIPAEKSGAVQLPGDGPSLIEIP